MTDTLVFGTYVPDNNGDKGASGRSFRQVIPASLLTNVTRDQLWFQFLYGYGKMSATVGISAGGLDISPGTIEQITFNGGASYIDTVQNKPIISDAIDFPYDGTDDLVVTIYFDDDQAGWFLWKNDFIGIPVRHSTGDQTYNIGGTWAGFGIVSEGSFVHRIYARDEADPTALRGIQAQVIAVYAVPAEYQRINQAQVSAVVTADVKMRVQQAQVIAVVKGRTEDRKVRAWTFTLDGHDFYVLRAGEEGTLVYDVTTKQWCQWSSLGLPVWRAMIGMNWNGMSSTSIDEGASSTGIAGDDTLGLLWTIKPEQGYDENPTEGGDPTLFVRRVTGGLPMRLRTAETCSAVFLTAALDSAQYGLSATDITLRTSDDNGRTFVDHGTVTIEAGDYTQEISWRSLGLIRAPGKIFEISDTGATVRIDGLDMRTTDRGDLPEG